MGEIAGEANSDPQMWMERLFHIAYSLQILTLFGMDLWAMAPLSVT